LALNFVTGKILRGEEARRKVNAEAVTPYWIVAEYAAITKSAQTEYCVRMLIP
jgi:hypothetical protein